MSEALAWTPLPSPALFVPAVALPAAVAAASTVRLRVAVSVAPAATVSVVVAVSVAVAFALPIETKPPPPLVEIAATLPRLSVRMTTSRPESCAPALIVLVSRVSTEAVELADLTSTTPPPEPEPEAVTIRSPDGAPASVSPAPMPSRRCGPLPAEREVEHELLVAAAGRGEVHALDREPVRAAVEAAVADAERRAAGRQRRAGSCPRSRLTTKYTWPSTSGVSDGPTTSAASLARTIECVARRPLAERSGFSVSACCAIATPGPLPSGSAQPVAWQRLSASLIRNWSMRMT